MQAFKSVAVEESSLSLSGSGMQQERLLTHLSLLLFLSTAKGWLFPSFQLLSGSKERIFLIFSTQNMAVARQREGPSRCCLFTCFKC